jgi:uracil-DNA glycosylase
MLDTLFDYSWKEILQDEFKKSYFQRLNDFLIHERANYTIYPLENNIFNAFNLTPFGNIKVVILGQDPYHGYNQSHGLAFSVNESIKHPPSLINIFKELHTDIGCNIPISGNLSPWAAQGVFLLNTVLSVRESNPNSHKEIGWELFTDCIIKKISDKRDNIVFILWGKPAQEKIKLIDQNKHLIISSPHPSPLSSYRGFFGSKPFSKTNIYLSEHSIDEINWCL